MGSFWGHVDEGLFFIVLAIWWMLHAFREYIAAESGGQVMRPNIHYSTTIARRTLPIEIIFKILFPVVGFCGEFFDGGVRFLNPNGTLAKLIYQQHMTIYGIFIIHGVVDLMAWFKVAIIPSFNYVSAALAFLWYGVAFYFHASMHGKEVVETAVHIIPIPVMFVIFIAIICEAFWREGVWTMFIRSYGLLILGTWFSHVAFMLYVYDRFPGGESSDLDRSDPNNVTYVTAMFGMHLLVNLVISLILYAIVYVVLRVKHGLSIEMPKYGACPEQQHYSKMDYFIHKKSNGFKHKDTSSEDSAMLLSSDQSSIL